MSKNWGEDSIPKFDGYDMDVSENSGTPKSSILIGFSIINHPFWGTPIFGNTHRFQMSGEKLPTISGFGSFKYS